MEEQEGLAQAKKEIETALTKLLMAETNLFQDGVIGLNLEGKGTEITTYATVIEATHF